VKCEIAQLGPGEWRRLRAIRLRALEDAPDGFEGTLSESEQRSDAEWERRLGDMTTFVATSADEDVGMIRVAADSKRRDAAWLLSLWVAPDARGTGAGSMLVDAVVAWARARGCACVLLDVGDHNHDAIALYARKGFVANGITGSLRPPRQHIRQHQRELRLDH
jgi:GNAT superfamily N-acetyltransferase